MFGLTSMDLVTFCAQWTPIIFLVEFSAFIWLLMAVNANREQTFITLSAFGIGCCVGFYFTEFVWTKTFKMYLNGWNAMLANLLIAMPIFVTAWICGQAYEQTMSLYYKSSFYR